MNTLSENIADIAETAILFSFGTAMAMVNFIGRKVGFFACFIAMMFLTACPKPITILTEYEPPANMLVCTQGVFQYTPCTESFTKEHLACVICSDGSSENMAYSWGCFDQSAVVYCVFSGSCADSRCNSVP